MLPVLRDTQIYREVATLILLIYLKIERNRILATGTGVALFVLLGYSSYTFARGHNLCGFCKETKCYSIFLKQS